MHFKITRNKTPLEDKGGNGPKDSNNLVAELNLQGKALSGQNLHAVSLPK